MTPLSPKNTLVVVDRDGTLIVDRHYLSRVSQVRWIPGAVSALRRLRQAGYRVIIVTNQSGVGRGWMTASAVETVHAFLQRSLRKRKVVLDGIYWCPHAPGKSCRCRKPKPFLVRQALRELKMKKPYHVISIGDKPSDVQLGQHLKGKGILVLTGYGLVSRKAWKGPSPDAVVRDFSSAVSWITKHA